MCGICGIVSFRDNIDFEIVRKMNDAIAHRGPDDEGYVCYSSNSKNIIEVKRNNLSESLSAAGKTNVHLGHRRLSIIDVSESGHQPFKDKSGKYFLSFNGEIYNYIELKNELEKKGYSFTSGADTEVLLFMYLEYGEDCLKYLNGMWSFVILDTVKNVLFGSRDRFGVKPFYFFQNEKYFIFSSEIKSLIKAPQIYREINEEALFDYLTLGRLTNENTTLFKGLIELEPSVVFNLNLNNFEFKKRKYYNLKYTLDYERYEQVKSKKYIEEIKEKIFNAVNIRLRSDVKVGSCLSGGVDSSSIVCVINSLLKDHSISQVGDRQQVFTSVFPGRKIDESKWASMIVDATETEWFKTYPESEDLLKDLETLVYVQDVPFGSTTIYSQFRVMKLAAENGIKVLLDGQGGDELFSGYVYFYRSFFNELIGRGDFKTLMSEFNNLQNSPIGKSDFFRGILMSFAKLYLPDGIKRKLFDLKIKENTLLEKNFYGKYMQNLKRGRFEEHTNLNQALFDQFTRTSLKELLKYEDRNSMNFSIEARTPFSDDVNLIDYVFSIPSVYKIHNGWSKYLLRESMKGIVPEPIRMRTDKLGFATPEYDWMNAIKDNLKIYFTKDLDQYFNTKEILDNWDQIFTNQFKTGFTTIWRYLNFAVWKKVYSL
ncbi:MAG: Asparagine synthetase [glutamine-hydrolyzing] 1 [Ignavibacteria bacterium]|nr:Asparagine synthetase [glutamine-hydrolyzing] 1 [Ignavibacteria bacterium]